jgi:hypothetical protein
MKEGFSLHALENNEIWISNPTPLQSWETGSTFFNFCKHFVKQGTSYKRETKKHISSLEKHATLKSLDIRRK